MFTNDYQGVSGFGRACVGAMVQSVGRCTVHADGVGSRPTGRANSRSMYQIRGSITLTNTVTV